DNFVAPNKSIICHANLQIVLETFSHTQQASKYSLSNGAETALTYDETLYRESFSDIPRVAQSMTVEILETICTGAKT
ncbi:hypothetical protein M8037_17575, partial [Sinorhizobium meliloti]|nr:hypothetical protein [Sinorhizobium meliloti]